MKQLILRYLAARATNLSSRGVVPGLAGWRRNQMQRPVLAR